jgi:hypothetical protein
MLERRHEALLNRVLGIFPIVGDVLSNSGEIAIVTPCELLESRYISILSGMDKLQSSLATAVRANSAESAVIFIQLFPPGWQRES